MTQTVYVDMLWMINFCMDLLTLGMTARILQRKTTRLRLCLAAALGGGWAVAALLWGISGVPGLLLDLVIAIGMLVIAFRWISSGRRAVTLGTFFLISFLLGGSMTAMSRLFADGYAGAAEGQRGGGFLVLALAGSGITLLCTRVHRHTKHTIRHVSVGLGEHSVNFRALEDSGNLLRDPLSGRGVIFVSPDVLRRLCTGRLGEVFLAQQVDRMPHLSEREARRLRILPGETVHGRQLMLALLPDTVTVEGERCTALICPGANSMGTEYEAVLPASLAGERVCIIGKELGK